MVLLLLSLLIFGIFIIPNLTGAKDATMLSVFEHDEFAQYPNVIHMLQPGESLKATLHNFLVYLHYYYGYPFYFFSALAILPVKWILGADWTFHTQLIVAVLRQMVNVLPMLLAAFILVRDQLKSNSPWKALVTFLLLMTLPAVVRNNLWWHPDSLLTLFVVLTIFFLVKDDGKLGKFFYFSGIACGLAIGAKFLGALFLVTYICILVFSKIVLKHSLKKIVSSALFFLFVMFGTVLISNPLLLLPIERGEIIAAVKIIMSESTQGFTVANSGMIPKFGNMVLFIKDYYGGFILFSLALINLVITLFRRKQVFKNLVILTWFVGFMGYFVIFASTLRPHYFIPAVLPLYSTLLDWLPDDIQGLFKPGKESAKWLMLVASVAIVLAMLITIGINTIHTADAIQGTSQREETSPSLAMFDTFEAEYLPSLPANTPLIIYRDWRAYVADDPHWRVIYNWNLATYDYINENKPDFLFIEFDNVHYFSDVSKLDYALDREAMQAMFDFYSDVLHEKVSGYHLLYNDSFGYIFVSNPLFEKYYLE